MDARQSAEKSSERGSGLSSDIRWTSNKTDESYTRLFLGGSWHRSVAQTRPAALKMSRHSTKKGPFRRQAINLAPPRRVKAWRDSPLRLEEINRPARTPVCWQASVRSKGWSSWYFSYAPPSVQVWHKIFLGGSGHWNEAHTRPAALKCLRPRWNSPKRSASGTR